MTAHFHQPRPGGRIAQRIRMTCKVRPERPTPSEARAIVAAIAAQIVARVKNKTKETD